MNAELASIIARRKELFERHRKQFYQIFTVPLEHYMNMKTVAGILCGFDIVSFSENIVLPEPHESTERAIKRQYGITAVRLVRKLIQ